MITKHKSVHFDQESNCSRQPVSYKWRAVYLATFVKVRSRKLCKQDWNQAKYSSQRDHGERISCSIDTAFHLKSLVRFEIVETSEVCSCLPEYNARLRIANVT